MEIEIVLEEKKYLNIQLRYTPSSPIYKKKTLIFKIIDELMYNESNAKFFLYIGSEESI
jgi:hypothetical protein